MSLPTESILAIEIEDLQVRALAFEVIEGKYRYLAQTSAACAAGLPEADITPAAQEAVKGLERITSRQYLQPDPSLSGGLKWLRGTAAGLVVTLAGGPVPRTICAGLTSGLSLQSAVRLAASCETALCDTLTINDHRTQSQQIDSLIRLLPDLIIVAGGTEKGASQAFRQLLLTIQAACAVLPRDKRPAVLYAGNSSLQNAVMETTGSLTQVTYTNNIRPGAEEQLDPAQAVLADLVAGYKSGKITGAVDLGKSAVGSPMLTSASFGRMIRFMGQDRTLPHGILGIRIGPTWATAAWGRDNHLSMISQPWLAPLDASYLPATLVHEVQRWVPRPVTNEQVMDQLTNRSVFPELVASSPDEMAIDLALSRVRIQNLLHPDSWFGGIAPTSKAGAETVILSGSPLNLLTDPQSIALSALDGIQSRGLSTYLVDQLNLLPVLGACGQADPRVPADLLASDLFPALCTVITPISSSAHGKELLSITILREQDPGPTFVVRQGDLVRIPIEPGTTVRVHIRCEPHVRLGIPCRKEGIILRVTAGILGIIVDARGRPVRLPTDPEQRLAALQTWESALR